MGRAGRQRGAPVTGYRIEISTDNSFDWATAVTDTGSPSTTRTISGLTPGQPARFRVAAINHRGVGIASSPSTQIAPTLAPTPPTIPGYVALNPARLLDTRPDGVTVDGSSLPGIKLVGGREIEVEVAGRGGVPAGAAAVVLNVTVTEPDGPGYITAYPCGTTRPNASNVNFTTPRQTIANNVIVTVGATGTVCLYSSRTTHLIADINGALPRPPVSLSGSGLQRAAVAATT
jgi:hypothetical protein